MRRCPCGDRTSPDPSCDMCDGFSSDPDTGWGGYTNHFKGMHFNSEEEEKEYDSLLSRFEDEGDDDDCYVECYTT